MRDLFGCESFSEGALPAEDPDRFHKRYLRIVEAGYAQNPVTESSAGPKRRGLVKMNSCLPFFEF